MGKKLARVTWSAQGPEVLAKGKFLTLLRQEARNQFEDGQLGDPYMVECALPPFCDAVVLLLYAWPEGRGREGGSGPDPLVVLRRAARPCVSLRSHLPQFAGLPRHEGEGVFWELPAGGVEPEDLGPKGEGLAGRASLEAWEEAGLRVEPPDFQALGLPPFQAAAYSPERLHFLAAQVQPQSAQPAPGDGQPMEEGGICQFVSLSQALDWCRQGRVADIKTELGLLRLRQHLAGQGQ